MRGGGDEDGDVNLRHTVPVFGPESLFGPVRLFS